MLEARRAVDETRIGSDLRRADHRTEAGEVAHGGDVDVAVGRRERAHRHDGRMLVADLARHFVVDQPARGLEVHEADHRLEERRVHPLTPTGAVACDQRGEHALRQDRAGRGVGDRDPHARRTGARRTGDAHHAAEALCDLIDARAIRVRAVLTESGDARVDEARVHGPERVGIDAEPVLHGGAEVLDEHVGLLDEAEEHGVTLLGGQIDDHRALVAVEVRAVGTAGCERHRAARGLHLDDVGAEVGKLPHAGGAGPGDCQVDHAKAGERPVVHRARR